MAGLGRTKGWKQENTGSPDEHIGCERLQLGRLADSRIRIGVSGLDRRFLRSFSGLFHVELAPPRPLRDRDALPHGIPSYRLCHVGSDRQDDAHVLGRQSAGGSVYLAWQHLDFWDSAVAVFLLCRSHQRISQPGSLSWCGVGVIAATARRRGPNEFRIHLVPHRCGLSAPRHFAQPDLSHVSGKSLAVESLDGNNLASFLGVALGRHGPCARNTSYGSRQNHMRPHRGVEALWSVAGRVIQPFSPKKEKPLTPGSLAVRPQNRDTRNCFSSCPEIHLLPEDSSQEF